MQGFDLEDLPLTLREAVLISRSLQIQYIWIDTLCIVHNCNEEWAREAQKMMQCYAHARVTVVPVGSESADDGIFSGSHDIPFHIKVSETPNSDPNRVSCSRTRHLSAGRAMSRGRVGTAGAGYTRRN